MWQWREFRIPEGCEADHDQLMAILEELNDELTTRSEHWRSVEGDFGSPPTRVLQRRIASAKSKIADLEEGMVRWTADLLVGA